MKKLLLLSVLFIAPLVRGEPSSNIDRAVEAMRNAAYSNEVLSHTFAFFGDLSAAMYFKGRAESFYEAIKILKTFKVIASSGDGESEVKT